MDDVGDWPRADGARGALIVVWRALGDVWDHLFAGAACSLIWLAAVLLIVPGPPATVALIEMARRAHARAEFGPLLYLRAILAHFALGWRWGALALPVALVLAVDLRVVRLPGLLPPALALSAQAAAAGALIVWCVVNLYALALLFAQERPAVLLALRNGGVMLLRNPGYSATLAVAALLLEAVGLLLAAVSLLAGPIFLAMLADRAVADRLARWREGERGVANGDRPHA